jgi:ubiquinone/menaquinone biosynthesis C-methylase UbiE
MQKITRRHLRPFLEKYATKEIILEIGGGNTKNNHSYSDLFPNRHTVDIDPTRLPDTVGDAHELPFDDKSFNYILCTEVLEHLHTPQQAISQMFRVLKPGGILILTTRFVFPLHDTPNDYFRYTKYGLMHLFKDWEIVELSPETSTMSTIGALLQRIGFQTKLRGGKFTKILVYSLAKIFTLLDKMIKEEYGDITKKRQESTILTTGYYIVVKKI